MRRLLMSFRPDPIGFPELVELAPPEPPPPPPPTLEQRLVAAQAKLEVATKRCLRLALGPAIPSTSGWYHELAESEHQTAEWEVQRISREIEMSRL